MSKKLIHLFCFVLILTAIITSTVNAQDPSLVGYWKLDDEGTGTAFDYSGNDRHGTTCRLGVCHDRLLLV